MLTVKQKEVLGFIVTYQDDNKLAPTIKEISDHIGVQSTSTAHLHVKSLEEKGFIKRHENKSRSIEITNLARKVFDIKEVPAKSALKKDKNYIDIETVKNSVIKGDAIEIMSTLPDNSIDSIIADPPYNLSKGMTLKLASGSLKGAGGNWEKVLQKWDDYDLLSYIEFTELWLKEAKRVLKPTGSMWIFGTYHNIGIVNTLMQLLDIEIINEVIWYKRNAFPNLAGRRLTASHETLIWAHSGKKREYLFNYDYSKEFHDKSDNLKAPNKQMRTVWDIPNNKQRHELALGKHPTQKPLRICERMIELTTQPDDIVLAPFCGSGTECVAAKNLRRAYLGIEIEDEFVELTKLRLQQKYEAQETLL